jgi:phosphoribosylformimino-5-aminoimidazole carboxamide ribotide isomerase
MADFEIIPVIDVLNSKVVHAIKGERSKYKPLESYLFDTTNPIHIIKILNKKFKFSKFYIADLDAILHKKPNLNLYKEVLKNSNISIFLDPGIENENDIKIYTALSNFKLILGLETLKKLNIVVKGLDYLGKNKLILSIDMYNGKIISKIPQIKNRTPIEVIKKCENWGVSEIILLDLFRVGQKLGGIPLLYNQINKIFTGKILVGGGIKDFKDLIEYKNNNFSGVLIATALYDGSITKKEINSIKN